MEKLKNPPLNLVILRVEFPHHLKITETRSSYFDLVKADFPVILFPEIKSLAFDWADCIFRNQKNDTQIRIASNYFVLETTNYENVRPFWSLFESNFSKFVKNFSITEILSIELIYQNILKIDDAKIGSDFSDYFSLEINFKDKPKRKLVTYNGGFIFSTDGGTVQIEIKPLQNQETKIWDKLTFNINFMSLKQQLSIRENLIELKALFDKAHSDIEDVFTTSLTKKYFDSLK